MSQWVCFFFQGIQVIEHSGNHVGGGGGGGGGGSQQTVVEETVVEEMEVPLPLNETEEIIQSPVNVSDLLSSAVRKISKLNDNNNNNNNDDDFDSFRRRI